MNRHPGSMADDHASRLLRAIRTSARPLDDDELSQRTGIRPRQAVNQVLRRLEREGRVVRHSGAAGKIVTEIQETPGHAESTYQDGSAPSARDSTQSVVVFDRLGAGTVPAGSSQEQRAAEGIMLDVLGRRLGMTLQPARIAVVSGSRVEIDGSDPDPRVALFGRVVS